MIHKSGMLPMLSPRKEQSNINMGSHGGGMD